MEKNRIKSLVAEYHMWCQVFISASKEKPTGNLRPGPQTWSAQCWAGVYTEEEMDGESNLVDDLSSTKTMMTLPSFHNTRDYITDGPRLWEWLTVTAWRLSPHSTFWCYRNQRGISGPGRPARVRSGKVTWLRAQQDSLRLWKLKWQQRSLHFPIHPSASVLPVPMNGEKR